MKGFYCRLPDCSVLEVELWAIYRGLFVLQEGITPLEIEIETDAQVAVEIIQESPHKIVPFREMIKEIWMTMRRSDGPSLSCRAKRTNVLTF